MTARDYLESYREYFLIEQEKLRAYKAAEEKLYNISSSLGNIGTTKSNSLNSREDALINYQSKREAWAAAALNAIEVRQQVFDTIMKLSGLEQDVLYERYIELNTWADVSDHIGVCHTQTHRLHRKALAAVQVLIDNNCGNGVVIS